MAYTNNQDKQQVHDGIKPSTLAVVSHAHGSLANGITPTAISSGGTGTGSPGAVLGTGDNADLYTPGIEAV